VLIKPLKRGEVAHLSGLDIETVRFYEKQGLIEEPPRSESGYRQYSEEDVVRLRFIRRAKELGFTLKEISELLDLQDTNAEPAEVRAHAQAKIADIEAKVRDLLNIKDTLVALTSTCSAAGTTTCPIMEALNTPEGEEI
jgi:MerR family copper efflux transcriptional regulator